jgi:hypothetical protein
MNEKINVPPVAGTLKVYPPLASVTVPVAVPLTTTFTPGKGDPSSWAVTLPVTVRSCAHATVMCNRQQKHPSKIFLIQVGFVIKINSTPKTQTVVRDVIPKISKANPKKMTDESVYSEGIYNVRWVI